MVKVQIVVCMFVFLGVLVIGKLAAIGGFSAPKLRNAGFGFGLGAEKGIFGLVGGGDYNDIDRPWTAVVGVEIMTLFIFSISTEAGDRSASESGGRKQRLSSVEIRKNVRLPPKSGSVCYMLLLFPHLHSKRQRFWFCADRWE